MSIYVYDVLESYLLPLAKDWDYKHVPPHLALDSLILDLNLKPYFDIHPSVGKLSLILETHRGVKGGYKVALEESYRKENGPW
jgi:hypothetical protein